MKTNQQLLDGYLLDCRRRYLSERTIQNYAERLELLSRFADARNLADLKANDIEEWLDRHARCAQTRQTYRSTANSFFGCLPWWHKTTF